MDEKAFKTNGDQRPTSNRSPKVDRMRRKRRWILFALLPSLVLAAGWLARLLMREYTELFDQPVMLGSERVDVRIVRARDPILFSIKEVGTVGGGGLEYRMMIRFAPDRVVTVRTACQPRALWRLDGRLYIASCDIGLWQIARLDGSQLTPVRRNELPVGPKVFNLVPESDRRYWEEEFERWAK